MLIDWNLGLGNLHNEDVLFGYVNTNFEERISSELKKIEAGNKGGRKTDK